jgi:hypothetical protein
METLLAVAVLTVAVPAVFGIAGKLAEWAPFMKALRKFHLL